MAELVSTTYSTALFDVCVELNKVDEFLDEVNFVKESVAANKDFFELLNTPRINIQDKKAIVDNVYGNKLSKEVLNFIKILVDKRRVRYLLDIADEFEKMVLDHKGIVKALAYSSVKLSDDKIKKLENKLSQQTGKTVEIENRIDESLLGGVMIKFNDVVVDGTLKGKLKSLEGVLKN